MNFEEFVKSIRPECPLALDSAILRAVRLAATEFLKASEVWRLKMTYELLPGETEYDYSGDLPVGARAVAIEYVSALTPNASDRLLERSRVEDLVARYAPTHIALDTGNTKLVVDGNEQGCSITVSLVLVTVRDADELPDAVADPCFEGIRSLTLSKLFRGAYEWRSDRVADAYERQATASMTACRREARQDRSRKRKVAKFNRGFCW